MIPGEGPVVFDLDGTKLGSVISFEGGFSRYARQHVRRGAQFLVVATNEGSYGTTPASDQFIGMTRMRATELGVPVVHSAVTGRSVVIDATGEFADQITGLGTMETISSDVVIPRSSSPYAAFGDVVMLAAAVLVFPVIMRSRRVVGSANSVEEKE
jgi:apolipoprotein N-acyltransferase